MLASIVIRTYNEEKHLTELLTVVNQQVDIEYEVVIVDSGSTDRTLEIAESFGARITFIKKEEFTFGRSLNVGCEAALGQFLVFISGHCIPVTNKWLVNLVQPLIDQKAVYSYGRQVGRDTTKFSEKQVFKKYFPSNSSIRQSGFFCNNANAALLRSAWEEMPFDETLTGLEDMFLAKMLVDQGKCIAYTAKAGVYHIHDESWMQVKRRYEREAIALQKIMPQVHVKFTDFIRYFFSAVIHDGCEARKEKILVRHIKDIILFRFMHYWGAYRGNHEHRKLSARDKEKYFFPK